MSKIENIVPPVELCKQIPEGEFEDSALVWVYDDVVGFLCRTSGCEQIHKREWQLVHNHPRKIAIRRKSGHEIYPAPTVEEIIIDIGKTHKHPVLTYCHNHWESTCYTGYTNAELFWIKFEPTASEAALRLWFKVKGIEVK